MRAEPGSRRIAMRPILKARARTLISCWSRSDTSALSTLGSPDSCLRCRAVRARCKAAFAVDGVCPWALLLLPRRIATRPKLGTRLCKGLALSSPSGTSRSPRLDLSRSSLAARARSRAAVAAGEPEFGVSLSCISRCHWTSSGVAEGVVTARPPHDQSVLALLIRRGERG